MREFRSALVITTVKQKQNPKGYVATLCACFQTKLYKKKVCEDMVGKNKQELFLHNVHKYHDNVLCPYSLTFFFFKAFFYRPNNT